MIGKNLLWVAKQHGHSVQTMLSTYAAWTEDARDGDIQAIKRAVNGSPTFLTKRSVIGANGSLASPEFVTATPCVVVRWETWWKGGT